MGSRGLILVQRASLLSAEHADIWKMLDELRAERQELDDAILSLERLALARGKRRGRPRGKNKPPDNPSA